ncbi:unnamed protein product [Caenorhabditis auriculariae]|uniref:Pseudouridine-5'-phosphate glycosidase n=1 Tax=Caenorhabditis auriculariae TaxID=2777116 RepID=A0A8S1GV66_9PELO|nr:unnamed protein product [Caenorhabditis auriculariae]
MSRSTKRIFHQIRQFSHFLRISPLVQEALRNGKGVVALESTVITHGLPYPHNLKTAQELEEQVKSSGSQPATIALIDGNIHVGLDDSQLEQVATTKNAVKVSTRDIAKTLVRKELGGTTVAATMRIAHAAGIQFFATGGIGGVHRGAEQTFDISADLQELARTPVCVVCSGVKSILDIPKTIEYLETNSVNCVVFGKENIFPSFFTSKSESEGQFCTTCFDEIIALQETSAQLGFSAGTLLACPIPEKFAADGQVIQTAIDQALKEAKDQNVNSQRVTPFILARVNELTKGASMKTNIALLKNNAKIAGELANRKANSNKGTPAQNFSRDSENKKNETNLKVPRIVSIGASIVDFEAVTEEDVKVFCEK